MRELRGRNLDDIIGQQAYHMFPHEAPRAVAGHFVSFEVPVRAKTGEARWHLFNYLPYRDADGVVQGVVCHVSDLHLFVPEGGNTHDRYRRFSRQLPGVVG